MARSSSGTTSAQGRTDHLLRQDRLIASNSIRATFTGWHDRAIAAVMLVVALVAVRAWFVDRSCTAAAWAALGAGTMIGIGVARLVAMRLAFHAFDGVLAADALQPRTRRRYGMAWHGVGLVLLVALTVIARPSLLVVSVPAYLAGALVAGLAGGVVKRKRITGAPRPGWTFRAWSHRPIGGVVAAIALLLFLLSFRTPGANVLFPAIGAGTLLLALMLTGVDDATIRFMTIAGHGSRRVVAHHAGGIATFLGIAVPACWLMLGPVVAGIAAATGAAMLLLLTLRILAYRLHGKRFADLLVFILVSLLLLVAYAMPIVLPVAALALLWQLHRRGRTKRWLLA